MFANVEYCEPPPRMQLSQDHYLDQVYDSADESDDNWKEFREEAQNELQFVLQEGRDGSDEAGENPSKSKGSAQLDKDVEDEQ